jgi:hypothetical protein
MDRSWRPSSVTNVVQEQAVGRGLIGVGVDLLLDGTQPRRRTSSDPRPEVDRKRQRERSDMMEPALGEVQHVAWTQVHLDNVRLGEQRKPIQIRILGIDVATLQASAQVSRPSVEASPLVRRRE